MHRYPFLARLALSGWSALLILLLLLPGALHPAPGPVSTAAPGRVNQAFEEAAREFQVPASLLKALCYLEGHLSNHGGSPSVDNGYGCMHLIQNGRGDLLDQAAHTLSVSPEQVKQDMPTTIRAGAALLRADALHLSPDHSIPTSLSNWYGALALYSHATTRESALQYAGAVYTLLGQGFSTQADDGETVTLAARQIQPNAASAALVRGTGNLPSGCKRDQNVDYPLAIDCLVPAPTFDCNQTPQKAPCTFEGAQRPTDYAIDQIVIHDIEGNARSALNVFRNPKTIASVHYIVDSDGTIYQVVREKNIAYHAGNYWYNQHSIGIEHTGIDATGYRWYNASEYLASARLVAYLLKKYNLPLSHEQIVSHGTIPSPSATSLLNHVDPGPYWLWDYYLKLIHDQGVSYPGEATASNVLMLHPKSARRPLGTQGKETAANFNFFYLYNGPSTAAGRIPQLGSKSDITDVSNSVEADVSYYYLAKVADPAGSGATLYKIWYGVVDHPTKKKHLAHARLAWLAVPRGSSGHGEGTPIVLHTADGKKTQIYGQPTTGSTYVIGDAPDGATFVSTYTVTEDSNDTGNQNNTGNNNNTGNQNNVNNNPTGNQNTGGDTNTTGNPGSQNTASSTGNAPTGEQNAGDIGYPNTMSNQSVVNPRKKSDGAGNLWYEINYNHRQAWVPASEVTPLLPGGQ